MTKVIIVKMNNNGSVIPELPQQSRPLGAIMDVNGFDILQAGDKGSQPEVVFVATNEADF
jgi:hypothetical protein